VITELPAVGLSITPGGAVGEADIAGGNTSWGQGSPRWRSIVRLARYASPVGCGLRVCQMPDRFVDVLLGDGGCNPIFHALSDICGSVAISASVADKGRCPLEELAHAGLGAQRTHWGAGQ
jgi:hypothetical protein